MDQASQPAALTYASYLKIDELLSLQQLRSDDGDGPEHDEMLFIVIHQVYELWFKQLLHELDGLRQTLEENKHANVSATLKRILTILKTLVGQIDILETMTPVSFLSFRDRLESASGFQSVGFREFEFVCGNKKRAMIDHHADNPAARDRLQKRFDERTVYDSFLRYRAANGYAVPDEALHRDVTAMPQESPAVQKLLIKAYHGDPATGQLCELLVDFDEGLQEWRYRHVKLVERTIGNKRGTGGSLGVEFLKRSLFLPVFPDLWAIRHEF